MAYATVPSSFSTPGVYDEDLRSGAPVKQPDLETVHEDANFIACRHTPRTIFSWAGVIDEPTTTTHTGYAICVQGLSTSGTDSAEIFRFRHVCSVPEKHTGSRTFRFVARVRVTYGYSSSLRKLRVYIGANYAEANVATGTTDWVTITGQGDIPAETPGTVTDNDCYVEFRHLAGASGSTDWYLGSLIVFEEANTAL